jgi:hypothetical protein
MDPSTSFSDDVDEPLELLPLETPELVPPPVLLVLDLDFVMLLVLLDDFVPDALLLLLLLALDESNARDKAPLICRDVPSIPKERNTRLPTSQGDGRRLNRCVVTRRQERKGTALICNL